MLLSNRAGLMNLEIERKITTAIARVRALVLHAFNSG